MMGRTRSSTTAPRCSGEPTTTPVWRRKNDASRGETPLAWGGSGKPLGLGLSRAFTLEAYEALFGPGGAKDPRIGDHLVQTRRPGMEIAISAQSVAELGVIGRPKDMHGVMDAERDATLAYLDKVTRQMGGRRGEAAVMPRPRVGSSTPTPAMPLPVPVTPARTTMSCSANLVEMADEQGGWKAADTALWWEHLHAATMVGRLAGARVAIRTGLRVEPHPGPSGVARPLAHRWRPRRGDGGPLQAGGRDRSRVPTAW